MKDIGGYFELAFEEKGEFHRGAIRLNLGRSALRVIVREYQIKNLFVPYFTCESVYASLRAERVNCSFYEVDHRFMPTCTFPKNAYILYTNYFGVCASNVHEMCAVYKNVIVDNTMAFYMPACGMSCFYSPRKFFGVADGAYLYLNKEMNGDLPQDRSAGRLVGMLKRIEDGSQEGYRDVTHVESSFFDEEPKKMSPLTRKILESIDYEDARVRRAKNLSYLIDELGEKNILQINLTQDDVAMKYPLLVANGAELKKRFIENHIFTASYWHSYVKETPSSSTAFEFTKNLIPLPIDQRYDEEDMQLIVKIFQENEVTK